MPNTYLQPALFAALRDQVERHFDAGALRRGTSSHIALTVECWVDGVPVSHAVSGTLTIGPRGRVRFEPKEHTQRRR